MVLAHDIRDREGTAARTADIATDNDVTFDSMLLGSRTLAGLTAAGFVRPSPVQLQGIPTGKCGFNLLLEAKSGTGKTAVFAVIALELLEEQEDAQIMILAPTREIASQITDVIRQIGKEFKGLKVEVVMGGLPLSEDIEKFANKRKVHVIVGSPGRLRHLIEENHINTSSVRLFVLDEADKLMEGSFKVDINYIFSCLPNCKQVIMSSATYPEDLKELVVKYMKKYIHICPNSTSVLLGIEQKLTVVKQHSNIVSQTQHRYTELVKIFKSRQFKQCLIFCNYQARVVEVCKKLKADKWPVQFLHGKQEQTDRLDALKTLQDYKCRILVSTDLAARGIDASNVDLVINFEIPYEWATYLHRIGRAGRYGSFGMAISIVSEGKEEKHFKDLLKGIGAPVNMKTLWTDEPVQFNELNGHENNINIVNTNGGAHALVDKSMIPSSITSTDSLWDFLNDKEDSANEEVLEDFDKLNESYNTDAGIEKFENLMDSFNNSNSQIVDVPFSTLKVRYDIHEKKFLNANQNNFNRDKIENGEIITKTTKINGFHEHDKPECSSKIRMKNHNKRHMQRNKHHTETINKNDDRTHLDNENHYTEDNCSVSDYFSETVNNEYYNNKNKYNVNAKSKTTKECRGYDFNEYYSSSYESESSSDESNTSSNESESSLDRVKSNSSQSETSSSDTDDASDSDLEHNENMSRQTLTVGAKNYLLWKRQLAARRSQIQMMVYIQELAKINRR